MQAPRTLDPRALDALRKLEWRLRRSPVAGPLAGAARSIFRGRGRDFDQVTPYVFGDDVRDVDWNVTARLGELHRKVFIAEREPTVLVVVQDGPALQFGSGAVSKRDVLLELAALIMLLAVINRERVGLIHLRADGVRLRSPSRHRAHALAAAAELFAGTAPDPLAGPPPSVLGQPIPQDAFLVLLGDPPEGPPPPDWTRLRRRHDAIGVRVEDAWERTGPPAGGFAAYDPTAQALAWVEASPASRAAHAAWRAAREQAWAAWWPDPADRLMVDAAADPLAALASFLRRRGARGAAA